LLYRNDNRSTDTLGSRLELDVAPGQTYFVRVRGQGGTRGDYQLVLDWLLANDPAGLSN
jgi:hypothetical protein